MNGMGARMRWVHEWDGCKKGRGAQMERVYKWNKCMNEMNA